MFLAYIVADVAQEGRFARAGLPRQEERLAGGLYRGYGVLEIMGGCGGGGGVFLFPLFSF